MKLTYIVFEMLDFSDPSAVSVVHVLVSCDITQASQLTDRNIVLIKYYFFSYKSFFLEPCTISSI